MMVLGSIVWPQAAESALYRLGDGTNCYLALPVSVISKLKKMDPADMVLFHFYTRLAFYIRLSQARQLRIAIDAHLILK